MTRVLSVALTAALAGAARAGPHAMLIPVPFTDVTIDDTFWSPRLEANREASLPHCFEMCEQTGRLSNFAKAAGLAKGEYQGAHFNDSDVFKIIEGAACSLATHPDAKLQKQVDAAIALIAAAQQPDGYLNSYITLAAPADRWKHIVHPARHELYCAGHLIEAGVAHWQMTGKRVLLDVARKLADHIGSVFGPGRRGDVPEHQGIELALIRLYRATREARYLELAAFFLEQRGNAKGHALYGSYSQDHLPVREQSEVMGHAVRAMYFCAGAADLVAESGDQSLKAACRRLWESATARKMYVTGGVGARRQGEAFGADYELPNETAYAETCAAIGLIFFAHRMLLLEGNAQYADVMERALYNALPASTSLDGRRFFYVNPLASRGAHHRRPWYGCACCPSNVVRVFPTVGGYIYARSEDAVYVNLYVAGRAKVAVAGTSVEITQATRYPWDGAVKIGVSPHKPASFAVCLRIPGWCKGARLAVNGRAVEEPTIRKGFARLHRTWRRGDVVDLQLPMPIERVRADPRVQADAGRVALQRGPVVYCVEAADHGGRVRHLSLPPDAQVEPEHRADLLGGVTVLKAKGLAHFAPHEDGKPASAAAQAEAKPVDLTAVPYAVWDNREPGEMVVWLPERPALAEPVPPPTIASQSKASASHCWPSDSVAAVNDQIDPPNSHDLGPPRLTWWDHRGTTEWVQYDFRGRHTVSAVQVYWFDDTGRGQCRVPKAWRLLWQDGKDWKPVEALGAYGVERGKFNVVAFKPVTTKAIRLEVELQPEFSGGILEWRVSK